jgi:hypothetical protein
LCLRKIGICGLWNHLTGAILLIFRSRRRYYLNGTEVLATTLYFLWKYFTFQSVVYMGTSKNSFLLRTAAISSIGVVRPKCVLEEAIGYACGDFDLPP